MECGRRKAGSRIVGGIDAPPGSWPWQVLVDYKKEEGPHWCGGSILTPYWIVTAAHCLDGKENPKDYTVTAGKVLGSLLHSVNVPVYKRVYHEMFVCLCFTITLHATVKMFCLLFYR